MRLPGRLAQTLDRLADDLELVERLRVQRERLLREHGLYDALPLIREFRENGV